MTAYFENADSIVVAQVQEDVMVDLGGSVVILSYDALYELALRLAQMIETFEEPSYSQVM